MKLYTKINSSGNSVDNKAYPARVIYDKIIAQNVSQYPNIHNVKAFQNKAESLSYKEVILDYEPTRKEDTLMKKSLEAYPNSIFTTPTKNSIGEFHTNYESK